MKTFTKISLIASVFISIYVIVLYASCNKDKCKGVSCQNGGVCNSGKCTCATGYEGPNCTVTSRDKFLGNWTQTASVGSPTSLGQFAVSILSVGGVDSVAIQNFGNIFTSPIVAYLTGSDTLIIPHQLLDNQIVQGYAYYVNNGDIMVYYEDLNYVTNVLDTVYAEWK
jgi:hypothetical protein